MIKTELNPLKGIDAAIHKHYKPESLNVFAALSIYTKNAAALSFDEHKLGLIKSGYQADMTVCSKEITQDTDFSVIRVKSVIKKGKYIRF